jgi:hypothetical protein
VEEHQDVSGAERVGLATGRAETHVGVELAPLRGKSRGLPDSNRVWILLRSGCHERAINLEKQSNEGRMFVTHTVL